MKNVSKNYVVIEPSRDSFVSDVIDSKNLPLVSFCIPTYNNERTIEKCLQSIKEQNYPAKEIIIVDGNSSDKTVEIARKYTDNIFFDEGTLGSARQTSIEKSRGSILAIFDSDIIIPHKSWLNNAIQYFNYNDTVSTVWPMNIAPPGSSLTTRLYFNHWKIVEEDRIKNGRGLVGGGNALFLRKCMDEIGGVNRALHWGEDFDWAKKLKERGYQVIFIMDPLYHDTMPSLRVFARKQFTGAKTFTKTGFQLMDLSLYDVFNEQFVLGVKGMFRGLLKERDLSWLLFPFYISIRGMAYGYTLMKR